MELNRKKLAGVGLVVVILLLVKILFNNLSSKKSNVSLKDTLLPDDNEEIFEREDKVEGTPRLEEKPTPALAAVDSGINSEVAIMPTIVPSVAILSVTPTLIPTIKVLTIAPTREPTLIPTVIPTRISTPITILPTATPTPKIVEVERLILSANKVSLYPGEKQQVTGRVEPDEANDKTIEWSSDNLNIVDVDNNGLITAVNDGLTKIIAKTRNNKTSAIEVEVKRKRVEVESISLNLKNVVLLPNKRQQIKAVFSPNEVSDKTIIWSSSNANVATIADNGLVTAKEPGIVLITARTLNGKTAEATVTVTGGQQPVLVPTTRVTLVPTVGVTTPPVVNRLWKFNYDEADNKPFMQCSTYTGEDRVRLENLLKQAVDSVGRGTRAGVVEAARFLVGGLDYKLPYLGPKKIDSTLGRYKKQGLNIGNSKGWGCRVSGWTQGMDCTNFVYWAIVNGGLNGEIINPQSRAVPLAENVSKVRVGDFLLTLSDGSVSWTYSHTSIIIGIDENYFYVAEAKGSGTKVSKVAKNNLPSRKQNLGMVSLGQYPSEGKVTNMWNQ